MAKLGPLPHVPQMLKLRYLWALSNHTGVNVFHISYTGSIPDATTMGAILTQIATLTTTNIKPLVNQAVSLTTIEATDISSPTGILSTVAGFGTGTVMSGAPLADNTAACVSFLTNLHYRGGHPRMYLPGQQTVNTTNTSSWTPGWVTTVQNGMIAWRSAINSMTGTNAPFQLQWVSYYTHDANHNPIYHPGGPQPYPVLNFRLHTRIDSQRKRLGKET